MLFALSILDVYACIAKESQCAIFKIKQRKMTICILCVVSSKEISQHSRKNRKRSSKIPRKSKTNWNYFGKCNCRLSIRWKKNLSTKIAWRGIFFVHDMHGVKFIMIDNKSGCLNFLFIFIFGRAFFMNHIQRVTVAVLHFCLQTDLLFVLDFPCADLVVISWMKILLRHTCRQDHTIKSHA